MISATRRPAFGPGLIKSNASSLTATRRMISSLPRPSLKLSSGSAAATTVAIGVQCCHTSRQALCDAPAPSSVTAKTAEVNTAAAGVAEIVEAADTRISKSSAAVETPATFWDACKFIWRLVDGRLLLLGCFLTVAGVVLQLIVPIKSAALLRAAQQGGLTIRSVLAVIGVANLKALCNMGGAACLASAGNKLKRKLRSTLFASILAQELGWLHSQPSAIALIASIGSDTDTVGHAVTNSVSMGLGSMTKVVGSLVSLTLISPQLTCLVLLLAPPTAVFAAGCARYESGMRRRNDKASEAAMVSAGESVEKAQTVQAYAQEARECSRYDGLLAKHGALERTLFLFHRTWTTIMQLVVQTGTALSLALAGYLAHRGQFDPSMLLPFSQLAMGIGQGVGQLTFLSGDAAKVRDAVRRLREVSEREPLIRADVGYTLADGSPFFHGEMSIEDVTFSYPARPEQKVLDGCSIKLEPGKTTALVGPSGGGKSTLQLLLARFFDPERGTARLDGADLRELQPRWLRGHVVGVVTQEPVLLPGTVKDNIAYSRPGASDEEVVAAAKDANAHDFISRLADGYDTQLGGGGGGGLSVGQKQRLAIARALLKDPKVLLLDEPTSALDPASEAAVQQALDRLSAGRTTLVVAHRLSTVKHADAIYVLVAGRVVEKGTHGELLALGGEYAKMVQSQSLAAPQQL